MKKLSISIMISIATLHILHIALFAQIPRTPTIQIPSDGVSSSTIFTIVWDSIPGASSYRVDVAEDSTFKVFVPGLQNFYLEKKRYGITVYGLFPRTTYYCRVRAVSPLGVSNYSPTQVVSTGSYPLNLVTRLVDVSDNSCTLEWTPAATPFEPSGFVKRYYVVWLLGAKGLPNIEIAAPSLPLSGRYRYTIPNLQPDTTYTCNFVIEDALGRFPFSIYTTSSAMKPFRAIISFYEGPVYPLPPERDTTNFYTLEDSAMTVGQAEKLLMGLRSAGIDIDTAWFHTNGYVIYETPIYYRDPLAPKEPSMLILKTRKSEARLRQYGFSSRVGLWLFSEQFQYFRYVFSRTTSVEMNEDIPSIFSLTLAPNPASSQALATYTIPNTQRIRIELLDGLGRIVRSFDEGRLTKGKYERGIYSQDLADGVYFLRFCFMDDKGNCFQKTTSLHILK